MYVQGLAQQIVVSVWLTAKLLLGLASRVILGSESHGTHDHISLPDHLTGHSPEGSGPCIYVPQWQDGPVIPPGTGFPFRRLLRLAGLRWRYSNPPRHEDISNSVDRSVRLLLVLASTAIPSLRLLEIQDQDSHLRLYGLLWSLS
jgi:hypothetical protein